MQTRTNPNEKTEQIGLGGNITPKLPKIRLDAKKRLKVNYVLAQGDPLKIYIATINK